MANMRERSGSVTIDDKLVSFLYELMRDHLTPGQIESLVMSASFDGTVEYTNGWLASYAEDIARRLK